MACRYQLGRVIREHTALSPLDIFHFMKGRDQPSSNRRVTFPSFIFTSQLLDLVSPLLKRLVIKRTLHCSFGVLTIRLSRNKDEKNGTFSRFSLSHANLTIHLGSLSGREYEPQIHRAEYHLAPGICCDLVGGGLLVTDNSHQAE